MLNILESYDLQGFITGETQPPPQFLLDESSTTQPNPLYLQWRRSDWLVKGWLTATLSEAVLGIVIGLNAAQGSGMLLCMPLLEFLLIVVLLSSKDSHLSPKDVIP
ncbi:hypothetical protein I3843_06G079700 [Carya illinoinensis]|nr:hypothetical protein I3843_06G079700 [Carya illinoinensis]